MKTGAELITEERNEHFDKHNRSIENDVKYNGDGQLMYGAVALLLGDEDFMPLDWDESIVNYMLSKKYKNRLVIAGALIAAEIDRLQNKK